MTFILRKYKLFIIAVISLVVLAALTWSFTTKTKANKIPSRGVFVLQEVNLYV